MDLYFTEDGDIAVGADGDLALTKSEWRDDVQQAYVRMMTDIGDWLTYPNLGATLSKLFGEPQSSATGQFGVDLVTSAMDREGRFTGKKYVVNAVPTSPQTIRFDVSISSGSQSQIILSVEQELGIT